MEHREYNYYEANAADVNLEEITSSAKNAKILQQLRDGDPTLRYLYFGGAFGSNFNIGEGDDLGWLGYFIGRSSCLTRLFINYLPDGEEGRAFVEGIARSQSIQYIGIDNLSNDGFTSIIRALHSLSQLEELYIGGGNNVGPDGWSELRILLESGVCKLKQLLLKGNNYIGNEGMDVLSNGLRGIGSSLKVLHLSDSSIGNEGLLALVDGLTNCTSLETLQLSRNDFSSAAAGLGSLSDWLQNSPMILKYLFLDNCRISDEGLHALAEGAANQCRELYLKGNETITTVGLRYLSDSIRSDSCRVESLDLECIPVGDEGLEVLAQGLVGNQSLTSLDLGDLHGDVLITSTGWLAFSKALCDTSSVNSTYLSNHTIFRFCLFGGDDEVTIPPRDISRYLRLHEEHPQHVAKCKILMKHPHLDMTPFFEWKLKFLPMAVAWFERAMPCTALTIHDHDPDLRRRVLDESDESFESRVLTAMFEFVRGMPMEVMKSRSGLALAAAYDKKIAMIEEVNKIALEQRDRKNVQFEEEITRLKIENESLSGIVQSVRNSVGV
eukprot:scaffold1505_cov146-Skeletonema_marinoi.AAC.27